MYLVYNILLFLAALVYLPFYCLRGRVHAEILTRLGIFKKDFVRPPEGADVIWIHAVSVGEARAAESLLKLIRAEWPKKRIVVSTVTPTGQAIVKGFLKEGEGVFYAPLDISYVVQRFLGLLKPGLLIIMETEIWPNLIRLAKRRGTKVVIVNGRISDRSFRGYQRIRAFFEPVLHQVDLFCMQAQEAKERLVRLGVAADKIKLTGNIKFDISCDAKESAGLQRLRDACLGRLVLVGGSTHENEEEMLVEIYRSCVKDFPNLRLVIAPRHVERTDKIRRMVRYQGLEAVRFSRLSGDEVLSAAQVLLVDTVGDLSSLYRFCDIAFVGGSLVKKGGHNPIEPALFAKPVLFGRYMENFNEIRDIFVRENAALEVDTPQRLEYEFRRLLASPGLREEYGGRGRQLLEKNKGASRRTFAALCEAVAG